MANFAEANRTRPDPGLGVTAVDLTGLLGAAIRERRSSLQISQEELAVRAGLHRTYLSDVERGARNPSIKTIDKTHKPCKFPLLSCSKNPLLTGSEMIKKATFGKLSKPCGDCTS
jgi:transcriptional regulator with XRE-family HTH domain